MAFLFKPLQYVLNIVNATITTANTSQEVIPASLGRVFIEIQNTSDTAMWMNWGTAAATDVGTFLAPGATYRTSPGFCPTNNLNIVCATAGKKFNYAAL
jgi:hypothetical protein